MLSNFLFVMVFIGEVFNNIRSLILYNAYDLHISKDHWNITIKVSCKIYWPSRVAYSSSIAIGFTLRKQ